MQRLNCGRTYVARLRMKLHGLVELTGPIRNRTVEDEFSCNSINDTTLRLEFRTSSFSRGIGSWLCSWLPLSLIGLVALILLAGGKFPDLLISLVFTWQSETKYREKCITHICFKLEWNRNTETAIYCNVLYNWVWMKFLKYREISITRRGCSDSIWLSLTCIRYVGKQVHIIAVYGGSCNSGRSDWIYVCLASVGEVASTRARDDGTCCITMDYAKRDTRCTHA